MHNDLITARSAEVGSWEETIDRSEKRICRLSFEFLSPYVNKGAVSSASLQFMLLSLSFFTYLTGPGSRWLLSVTINDKKGCLKLIT